MEKRKPRLTVLASTENTAVVLGEQMQKIFGNELEIRDFCFSQIEKNSVEAELVLVSHPGILDRAKEYIREKTRIFIAKRNVPVDAISRLADFPEGARIVVANVDRENATEAIAQLQDIGINRLNYAAYYPESGEFPTDAQGVVIFGEDGILHEPEIPVIDFGTRIADQATCVMIAGHFGIYERVADRILDTFMQHNIHLNNTYAQQIDRNQKLALEMQMILNRYQKSTILMNVKGEILFYNPKAGRLLEIENDVSPYMETILKQIRENERGFFLEIKKRSYFAEFSYSGDQQSLIIIIDDVRHVEETSETFRNILRKNGLVADYTFQDIVGNSPSMVKLKKKAAQFAKSESTIHIHGESGCGKELLAQAVHNGSKRKNNAFVAVNLAALSSTVGESELFGYAEGAFTGAKKGGKKGLFELAHNGTIFLDEIGDCSLDTQKKILRVLQERKVMPIGSNKIISVDVRIISATNKDLKKLVQEGRFREDLYYRLNVLPLRVPPLRERKEDILPMFYSFLDNAFHVQIESVGEKLETVLQKYDWPGNVRELRNMAEYTANCISADMTDWEQDVMERLMPKGVPIEEGGISAPKEYKYDGTEGRDYEAKDAKTDTFDKLETDCEQHLVFRILAQLGEAPYVWTRAGIADALPDILPGVIKRYLGILRQYGLVYAKKGEGTRISRAGISYLQSLSERERVNAQNLEIKEQD